MSIVRTLTWGSRNPLSDPRLANLDQYVAAIRRGRRHPNVVGGSKFKNAKNDLPVRAYGYYKEYDVTTAVPRDSYRLVLGDGGEVFVTWDHYDKFYQIVGMPIL